MLKIAILVRNHSRTLKILGVMAAVFVLSQAVVFFAAFVYYDWTARQHDYVLSFVSPTTRQVTIYDGLIKMLVPTGWAISRSPLGDSEYTLWSPLDDDPELEVIVLNLHKTHPNIRSSLDRLAGRGRFEASNELYVRTWEDNPNPRALTSFLRGWDVVPLAGGIDPSQFFVVNLQYTNRVKLRNSYSTRLELAQFDRMAHQMRFELVGKSVAPPPSLSMTAFSRVEKKMQDSHFILFASVATFFMVFVGSELVFNRVGRLTKSQWIFVSQGASILSLISIVLASFSIYRGYLEDQIRANEITAQNYASMGSDNATSLLDFCNKLKEDERDLQATLNGRPDSVEFSCGEFRPAIKIIKAYFDTAVDALLERGDIIDPEFRIAMPMNIYNARLENDLKRKTSLDETKQVFLLKSAEAYRKPLTMSMNFLQMHFEDSSVASTLDKLYRFWSVLLAAALALNLARGIAEAREADRAS